MKYRQINIDHLLSSVLKPARYCNQEINSFHKYPSKDKINFCFAFPDLYEVGTSHLGIKILYSIINKEEDSTADRVYSVWSDFEEKLKIENIPLFAIESKVILKDFDVLGITLQSELTFTNILNMLTLAQIPIRTKNRSESDPIIIGGGPCASNPEPLAIFFDAFLIGDGEEAILEIKNSLLKNKEKLKIEKMIALSKIPGVYIPQFYQNNNDNPKYNFPIKIRKYMNFSQNYKTHDNQLIPWIKSTHDRYVVEIMRGCTRGCRFCHAGMFYRPVREKSPQKIVDQLVEEIKKFGWEEAALTSLSSSDYTCIQPVLKEINNRLKSYKAKLSLPSLRVDSLNNELLELMKKFGSNGITIAPEAGSQKIRDVINKQLSEKDILDGVKIALENGWSLIKLYFMIGLPHETEDDINAIIDVIEKIIKISNKKIKINVTISPFVPKPFTPFQWEKMQDKEYLLNTARNLKERIKKYKFIKMRYHEIQSSMLEAILTRGDRKVGYLIEQAFNNGAKFDGWDEFFDFSIWEKSAKQINLNIEEYLKEIPIENKLPWDHISIGVTKNFLLKEREKSIKALSTEDCKTGKCSACGVCKNNIKIQTTNNDILEKEIKLTPKIHHNNIQYYNYRIFYSKKSPLTFVGHLDIMRMIHRLIRIAQLPLGYSFGYNPHPKISLGPPLPLGVKGENEYFDISLYESINIKDVENKLKNIFPKKLEIKSITKINNKKEKEMKYLNYEKIELIFPKSQIDYIKKHLDNYNIQNEIIFKKIKKNKIKEINIKEIIKSIEQKNNIITILKKVEGASIFDILKEIFNIDRYKSEKITITRKKLIHL